MNNYANAGMLAADARDLFRREPLVHGAVTLPQDDACLLHCISGVSAEFLVGIPNNHFFKGDSHAIAGIASEMLVGKEKYLFTVFKSPFQDGRSVGAGANRAVAFPGKRLDGRGRVHVAYRNDLVGIRDGGKFVPASFHLADVGHIGHGAAGVQIRQHDDLMLAAKNVRAFGHEVDTAEDDVAGVGLGSLERKFQGITAKVCKFDDFVALVVVPEDDDVFAQAGLGVGDAFVQGVVG